MEEERRKSSEAIYIAPCKAGPAIAWKASCGGQAVLGLGFCRGGKRGRQLVAQLRLHSSELGDERVGAGAERHGIVVVGLRFRAVLLDQGREERPPGLRAVVLVEERVDVR